MLLLCVCAAVATALAQLAHAPHCHAPQARLWLAVGVAATMLSGAATLYVFRRLRYFGWQATTIRIDPDRISLGFLGALCDLPRAQITSASLVRCARADTQVWAGASCPISGPVLVFRMQDGFSPARVEMPLYALNASKDRIARDLGAAEVDTTDVAKPRAVPSPPVRRMQVLYRSRADVKLLAVYVTELVIVGGIAALLFWNEWQDLATVSCGGPPFPFIALPLCGFAGAYGLMLAAILPILAPMTPASFAIGVETGQLWLMHGKRRIALPRNAVIDIKAELDNDRVDIRPWAGGSYKAAAAPCLRICMAPAIRPESLYFPAGHLADAPASVAAKLKAALGEATAKL